MMASQTRSCQTNLIVRCNRHHTGVTQYTIERNHTLCRKVHGRAGSAHETSMTTKNSSIEILAEGNFGSNRNGKQNFFLSHTWRFANSQSFGPSHAPARPKNTISKNKNSAEALLVFSGWTTTRNSTVQLDAAQVPQVTTPDSVTSHTTNCCNTQGCA